MRRWRKLTIFAIMLALPLSMCASITMSSHCQPSDDTSHDMHVDDDMHAHMHNEILSKDKDSSDHSNCDCGCDGSLDCSVSGCSASVISSSMRFDLQYLTQSTSQQIQIRAEPPDPNLLFRPPIFSS